MSYQETTGTLNANQHGSYTTQDALGDLLITDVLRKNKPSVGRITDQFYVNGKERRGGSVYLIKRILMPF